MGTDTAPVMENLKLCRFHPERDMFWISVTLSDIWRYVSASVTGCWGFCEWAKMAHCHFNNGNECMALHMWTCMFPGDLERIAGTQAQSGVTFTSHRAPAMAEPSGGWQIRDYVWVCWSPHVSMYYRYVIIIVIINITIIIIITHVCLTSNHWLSLLKLSSALSTPWAHLLYSIYSGGRNHSYILCTIPKVISWAHIILRDQWAFLASVTLVVAKYLYVCWRYWCICSNKPFLMWI